MQVEGPTAFTVGVPTTVPDPAETGGNPSEACQIQNSSPYQLNVLAAGDVLSIQAFTAQTFEISGQPITITPLTGTGNGACSLTVVFLLGAAPETGVQLPDGTWVETPPQQDGPLTAAAIEAANAPPGVIFGPSVVVPVASAITLNNIAVPPNARTLLITAQGNLNLGAGDIAVTGNTTGFFYYNKPAYLANNIGRWTAVVPIMGALDSSINVLFSAISNNPVTINIAADSLAYPESEFYTGAMLVAPPVTLAAAGNVTLLNGPARLLVAEVIGFGGAFGVINLAGNALLTTDSLAGQLAGKVTTTFPKDTILDAGRSLVLQQVGAGNTQANVAYAYP